jgi:hypothetical protein
MADGFLYVSRWIIPPAMNAACAPAGAAEKIYSLVFLQAMENQRHRTPGELIGNQR